MRIAPAYALAWSSLFLTAVTYTIHMYYSRFNIISNAAEQKTEEAAPVRGTRSHQHLLPDPSASPSSSASGPDPSASPSSSPRRRVREEIERRRRQRQQRPPPASDQSNREQVTPLHVRDHVGCGTRAARDVSSEAWLQAGREGVATQATPRLLAIGEQEPAARRAPSIGQEQASCDKAAALEIALLEAQSQLAAVRAQAAAVAAEDTRHAHTQTEPDAQTAVQTSATVEVLKETLRELGRLKQHADGERQMRAAMAREHITATREAQELRQRLLETETERDRLASDLAACEARAVESVAALREEQERRAAAADDHASMLSKQVASLRVQVHESGQQQQELALALNDARVEAAARAQAGEAVDAVQVRRCRLLLEQVSTALRGVCSGHANLTAIVGGLAMPPTDAGENRDGSADDLAVMLKELAALREVILESLAERVGDEAADACRQQ